MIRSHRTTAVLLAVLLVAAAAGPTVVAAQDSDETGLWGVVTQEDADWSARAWGFVEGVLNRYDGTIAAAIPGGEEPPTAAENADAAMSVINDHNDSETIEELNKHVADDVTLTNYDTLKVSVTGQEGNSATFYVLASVDNGTLTDFQAIESIENETVDYTVAFESAAASKQLSEDLEWLHSEYVEQGDAPDQRAAVRFGATYKGALNVTAGDA